jgi:type VI secretion system secreted protein Hcp
VFQPTKERGKKMPNMSYAKFGDFKGSCKQSGREGMVEILAMDHHIEMPISPNDGTATGIRRHHAMKLTANIDATTPLLAKCVAQGTTLKEVVVHFFSIIDGEEVNYFNIKLENARVTGVKMGFPNVHDEATKNYKDMVTYELHYEKITWTYTDGNIEKDDDWKAPVAKK